MFLMYIYKQVYEAINKIKTVSMYKILESFSAFFINSIMYHQLSPLNKSLLFQSNYITTEMHV